MCCLATSIAFHLINHANREGPHSLRKTQSYQDNNLNNKIEIAIERGEFVVFFYYKNRNSFTYEMNFKKRKLFIRATYNRNNKVQAGYFIISFKK